MHCLKAWFFFQGGCQAFQKLVPLSITYQTLSIICQWSWSSGEVPDDWRLPNMKPIYKKVCKEDPGNYRPVGLTSAPGKVMEQIILNAITKRMWDNLGMRPSQHGFMKGRSCLTNLISFYVWVT